MKQAASYLFHIGFFFFDPEDGGDRFLGNVC
jgi:hypothetical protein